VAPSGECLRGIGPPDRMLAASVSGSLLGYTWYLVVAVLRDSIGISLLSCVTVRCG